MCARCQTGFQTGVDHYSVLQYASEPAEWLRTDFCTSCWETAVAAMEPESIHSLWRTRYTDPDEGKRTPINEYTPLLEICYDALSTDEPQERALAYLSAMVLRRQKVFRFVRAETDTTTEQDALLFYDTVRQTEVRVPDPPMSPADLHTTRRVLQQRLAIGDDGVADALREEVVHEPR